MTFLAYLFVVEDSVSTHCVCVHTQSLTPVQLFNPIDCSLPGSSVHGVILARILEWVFISSSKGSSQPRDRTCVSCVGRWILYFWVTWEAPHILTISIRILQGTCVCVCVCARTYTYMCIYLLWGASSYNFGSCQCLKFVGQAGSWKCRQVSVLQSCYYLQVTFLLF